MKRTLKALVFASALLVTLPLWLLAQLEKRLWGGEAVYLMTQAKTAYIQSLRLDSTHWDARHNLDRVLTMLPSEPTPGVGESDSPGLIMGNIPVGLP